MAAKRNSMVSAPSASAGSMEKSTLTKARILESPEELFGVEVLDTIFSKHGYSLKNEPKRLRNLLSDYLPGKQKECNVLALFVENRWLDEVKYVGEEDELNRQAGILAERWHDQFGFDRQLLMWGIKVWSRVAEGQSFDLYNGMNVIAVPHSPARGMLEKHIEEAPDNATLILAAGEYHVSKKLLIKKSLNIVGSGEGAIINFAYQKDDVSLFLVGEHEWIFKNIQFTVASGERAPKGKLGQDASGLINLERGSLTLQESAMNNVGLIIGQKEHVKQCLVQNCEFISSKDFTIISIGDVAHMRVESGRFSGVQKGVAVSIMNDNNSSIDIANNHISGFSTGVLVGLDAVPFIHNNIVEKNNSVGIDYTGSSGGKAAANIMRNNIWSGIRVKDQAVPELTGNTCEQNGGAGLTYYGESGGTAQQNVLSKNKFSGIIVQDQASPELIGNTCEQNEQAGLAYVVESGGTAQQNVLSNNKMSGIIIQDQASPELIGNTCAQNEEAGLHYGGKAKGIAKQNILRRNKTQGILVGWVAKLPSRFSYNFNVYRQHGMSGFASAAPELIGNTCEQNERGGILFAGEAKGTATQNVLSNNKMSGIIIQAKASPELTGNTCEQNEGAGLAYGGEAKGMAKQNVLSKNKLSGIIVQGQASPELIGNTCAQNEQSGLAYFNESGGMAKQNNLRRNKGNGISVHDKASPEVIGNTCEKNQQAGLAYFGESKGTATLNILLWNKLEGVVVREKAAPVLVKNKE